MRWLLCQNCRLKLHKYRSRIVCTFGNNVEFFFFCVIHLIWMWNEKKSGNKPKNYSGKMKNLITCSAYQLMCECFACVYIWPHSTKNHSKLLDRNADLRWFEYETVFKNKRSHLCKYNVYFFFLISRINVKWNGSLFVLRWNDLVPMFQISTRNSHFLALDCVVINSLTDRCEYYIKLNEYGWR